MTEPFKAPVSDNYLCQKCCMTFLIGPCRTNQGEKFRCPECHRAFWATQSSRYLVRVGMERHP